MRTGAEIQKIEALYRNVCFVENALDTEAYISIAIAGNSTKTTMAMRDARKHIMNGAEILRVELQRLCQSVRDEVAGKVPIIEQVELVNKKDMTTHKKETEV